MKYTTSKYFSETIKYDWSDIMSDWKVKKIEVIERWAFLILISSMIGYMTGHLIAWAIL